MFIFVAMGLLGHIRFLCAKASYLLVICLFAHFVFFFQAKETLLSTESAIQLLSEKQSDTEIDFFTINMANAASQEEEEQGGKKTGDKVLENSNSFVTKGFDIGLLHLKRYHSYSIIQFHPENTTPPPEQA